jgi:hypothetical protein
VGRKIHALGNSQWEMLGLREPREILLPREQTVEAYVVQRDFPAIGHRDIKMNARRNAEKVV